MKQPEYSITGSWYLGVNIANPTYFGGGVGYQRNDTGWIYIIGGNGTGTGTSRTLRYNVNSNTWQNLQDMPAPLRVNSSALLKDSVYSVGGITTQGNYTNAFYKYSINDNYWATMANMPVLIAHSKAVGYQDSLIYVAGGSDGTVIYNSVYLYNANTNSWRSASSLPAPRVAGAFSRSGDTLVYIGGANSSILNTTFKGIINQSDRSIISWSTGTPYPAGPMFRMDAQPWGCKGIIVTGGSSAVSFGSVSNVCYTYSPGNNTWTQQPNKPTAWTCGQSGTIARSDGTFLLVCASGIAGQVVLNQTEIYYDFLQCSMLGNITHTGAPLKYELLQNYPNPFNSETKLTFSIPQKSDVKLVIYDVTGRETVQLINEKLNAGKYTISWNAANYSSGAYFYRIQVVSSLKKETVFQETKTMILLK